HLPAHQGTAVVLRADLPEAGVAAEERHVAAVGDELLQTVTHRRGPVLVMADRQHEAISLEHLGMELEVGIDREVEAVAGLLGPGDERLLPASVSAVEFREVVAGQEADIGALERDATHPPLRSAVEA